MAGGAVQIGRESQESLAFARQWILSYQPAKRISPKRLSHDKSLKKSSTSHSKLFMFADGFSSSVDAGIALASQAGAVDPEVGACIVGERASRSPYRLRFEL